MYIVNQGVLQEVGGDHNEKVFAELKQGSVFGEIALLAIGGNNRRTASIRAKGYATLFVLAKQDLQDVIKYYPTAQHILKKKAADVESAHLAQPEEDEDAIMIKVIRPSPHGSTQNVSQDEAKPLLTKRNPSSHQDSP